MAITMITYYLLRTTWQLLCHDYVLHNARARPCSRHTIMIGRREDAQLPAASAGDRARVTDRPSITIITGADGGPAGPAPGHSSRPAADQRIVTGPLRHRSMSHSRLWRDCVIY